jgi:hypothetical protein
MVLPIYRILPRKQAIFRGGVKKNCKWAEHRMKYENIEKSYYELRGYYLIP